MHQEQGCECEICNNGWAAFAEKLDAVIRAAGYAVMETSAVVNGRQMSMSYTIGLAAKCQGELLVFGLPKATARVLLRDAAHLALNGELPVDTPVPELANHPVWFKPIAPADCEDYIVQANNWAGAPVPALQMIWTDSAGKFPWEAGARDYGQPILPVNPLH